MYFDFRMCPSAFATVEVEVEAGGRVGEVRKRWKKLTRSCNINEVLRCGTCKANWLPLCMCKKNNNIYMSMRACACKEVITD